MDSHLGRAVLRHRRCARVPAPRDSREQARYGHCNIRALRCIHGRSLREAPRRWIRAEPHRIRPPLPRDLHGRIPPCHPEAQGPRRRGARSLLAALAVKRALAGLRYSLPLLAVRLPRPVDWFNRRRVRHRGPTTTSPYGINVYGWPIQQLLAAARAPSHVPVLGLLRSLSWRPRPLASSAAWRSNSQLSGSGARPHEPLRRPTRARRRSKTPSVDQLNNASPRAASPKVPSSSNSAFCRWFPAGSRPRCDTHS